MSANVLRPEFDPDRFAGRHVAAVGAQAGAGKLAASVYELDAGVAGCPFHFHHGNEELLVVLDGTLDLRGPGGTRSLPAGEVVAFPEGDAGAHSLINRSDAPARYVVFSTTSRPDVVEYPDTGARLLVVGERRMAYRDGAEADRDAVVSEAMRAAVGHDHR